MALENLCQFLKEFSTGKIPQTVIDYAKLILADNIGVIIKGTESPESKEFSEEIGKLFPDSGKALDFLSKRGMGSIGASTCNSFYARILKFDDEYSPGMIHPGAVIIPPLLSFSEEKGISGEQFIRALIAGYEVTARISESLMPSHYRKGFSPTLTIGPLGACAAICVSDKASIERTAIALTITAFSAGGMRNDSDLQIIDLSPYETAVSSSRGLIGYTSSASVKVPVYDFLTPDSSFVRNYSDDFDQSKITVGLFKRWEILKTAFKYYPGDRLFQGPVHVLFRMMKNKDLYGEGLKLLEVGVNSYVMDKIDESRKKGEYSSELEKMLGMILKNQNLDILGVTANMHKNREIMDYISKIRIYLDDECDDLYPERWVSKVIFHTNDNNSFSEKIDWMEVTHPDIESLKKKFMENTSSMEGRRRIELWNAIMNIEKMETVRELTSLLL
ncbi:MAG: MmgE/PrpD family protein [Thermoplasmataceae archaeon]